MTTQYDITVPLLDNESKSLAHVREAITLDLLAIAGGYSAHDQIGAWRDENGHTYQDAGICYTVTVDEAQAALLDECLPIWCGWLRQKCLYVARHDVTVSFVAPVLASESVLAH